MKRVLSLALTFFCLALWGDEVLFQEKGEFSMPIQTNKELEFTIPEMPKDGTSILLEFDARIDYPEKIGGHNATALLVYMNRQLVDAEKFVSCPIEFLCINGDTGEPGRWAAPRWNFETIKTGDFYTDLFLKKGANHYTVTYSPDFEMIDSLKNQYSSKEVSRSHFVFDLTSLCTKGKNVLAFRNSILPEHVAAMGGSLTDPKKRVGKLPIVFRNLTIHTTTSVPVRKKSFWMEELANISSQMRYYEPRRDPTEKYTAKIEPNGAISVASGKNTFVISSTFSYPGNGRKNGFPDVQGQEASWKPAVGADTCQANGAFYSVKRNLIRHPGYFEIEDTLKNLTDKPVPVMVRYEVPMKELRERTGCVWLNGMKVTEMISNVHRFPENPTLFIDSKEGGFGIVPADDVLRIHSATYVTPDSIQLRDEQLLLSPRKKVTFRVHCFPLEKGGYFDFINQLRTAWDLNGGVPIYGIYSNALQMPAQKPNFPAGIRNIHVVNNINGKTKWGLQLAEDKELHQKMKNIIMAYRAKMPPEVKVFANYMAPYFSNADGKDLEKFKDCVVVNRNGTYPMEANCRFYIPTKDNEFGKMITQTIDMMLDDWKADGIYFDYMEGADPYYTYNQTDGVSCDIDTETGNLIAEKGSYQLLSQDYLIWLIKHIREKGGYVNANRNHFTWTTMKALKLDAPFRWTECGYPSQLTRGHLAYCPLGLQRTFSNKIHIQVLRALYEGMLTSPYDVRYRWPENPAAHSFPFKNMEMHRGIAFGEDKIVTAVGGFFGWGDTSNFKCRIFDKEGRLRDENGGEKVMKDGHSFLKVVLNENEIAIIDRVK